MFGSTTRGEHWGTNSRMSWMKTKFYCAAMHRTSARRASCVVRTTSLFSPSWPWLLHLDLCSRRRRQRHSLFEFRTSHQTARPRLSLHLDRNRRRPPPPHRHLHPSWCLCWAYWGCTRTSRPEDSDSLASVGRGTCLGAPRRFGDQVVQQTEDLVGQTGMEVVDIQGMEADRHGKGQGSWQSALEVPSWDRTGRSVRMNWKEVGRGKLYQDWRSTARHGRDAGTEEVVAYAVVVDEVIVKMQCASQIWSQNFAVAERVPYNSQVGNIPLHHQVARSLWLTLDKEVEGLPELSFWTFAWARLLSEGECRPRACHFCSAFALQPWAVESQPSCLLQSLEGQVVFGSFLLVPKHQPLLDSI
jgi:hypothetical protein